MEDLTEAEVAAALREIAAEARALGARLAQVHARLPVSPQDDLMLLGEVEPDFSCRARAAIECALADHLKPFLETLLRIAAEEVR